MRAPTLIALALLSTFGAAHAQQSWDLRKAANHRFAEGEKSRSTNHRARNMKVLVTQGGNTLQDQSEADGHDEVYVEEVLAVDAEGQPTRVTRTYERLELDKGQDVVVAGMVITLTRDDQKHWTWKAADGAEVPPQLQERLDQHVAEASQEAQRPPTRDALLPAEPVATGASWELDPTKVAESMGLGAPELELDTAASKVKGTLVSVESAGGQSWMEVKVELNLAFKAFQGMPCPEPMRFTCTVEMRLPDGGQDPGARMRIKGNLSGSPQPPDAPPGTAMTMDVTIEGSEERAKAE